MEERRLAWQAAAGRGPQRRPTEALQGLFGGDARNQQSQTCCRRHAVDDDVED
jgi:hypothetical protein